MKKIVFILSFVMVVLSVLSMTNKAYAFILVDFEMPRDGDPGDYDHTVSTAYGDIDFNGRIWWKIKGKSVKDHTLGTRQGSFLKNTKAKKNIIIEFDFDVISLEAWAVVYKGDENYLKYKAFDEFGNRMKTRKKYANTPNWKKWKKKIRISGTPNPIRKLVIQGSEGNIFGIDDMKVHVVPEPASLFLLGLGLLGARLKRRKKKS